MCLISYPQQRTAGFDLYAVFDPLIAKSQAILLGNKLIRWINVSHQLKGTSPAELLHNTPNSDLRVHLKRPLVGDITTKSS